ncbi:Cupin 2, conserved barrel [Shewanella denitrificans OS217]|uniref:Cupin 2, conserved barrel n=1 Tax=Shewanella denitrificans (strain OS217 / ATCC BAA-1090 / DSM 15013) TaxID=318161 RepID=Q12LK5_SHEDO|nr:cupin domain-containing protein [Shewanella denitrificans]ABE55671.1 Cupin 2, conserved barrel [Shewanella denitrificans OS217]
MTKSAAISIEQEFTKINGFENRTPVSSTEAMKDAFIKLSDFDSSAIYLSHYSGFSEWERHPAGDELVQVIEGETTLVLLKGGIEHKNRLMPGELLVVPQGVWHRFESPKGLKVLTITPPPTEHCITKPTTTFG